jgi:succinate dehydrogenase/fumarate reductase cytochrome b subunit
MKNLLKQFALWVLHGIIGLALMGFLVVMVAEWAAGCGETYVDSKGVRHQNECIFIRR